MKVTINRIPKKERKITPRKELFEFGEMIGAELVVNERDPEFRKKGMRYYAHFKGFEVKERSCLVGVSGDANTVNGAIRNYAKRISRQTIVTGGFGERRREIDTPNLYYKTRKLF